MLSRSSLRVLFAISCVILALFFTACASKQGAKSSSQSHAAKRASKNLPYLQGDEINVCGAYQDKGVVAAKQSIPGGAAFEFATKNEELQEQLRAAAENAVAERQQLEDAFKDVDASKHNDGDGTYVQFQHDQDGVLYAVQNILQHGVNQNPQARKRVSITNQDGSVVMQLPSGGALISSKTDSAANETVEKWTDRTPAKLSYEETDQGARVTVETDDDRIDEIQKNVIEPMLGCD